ncbi:Zinc finger DNA binding protein [Operophtera brumata]|uniref:Zinc finger DNA binding protein n=1 Tax=Operophtera brumata TaxID=104452 RepID=A0A0L7KYQ3_OPEBR|nr:Zinc finger DNA binding protein [Operophtera brumata]
MDMPLDERDIVSVERVGATKISQEESTSTGTMRPRRVVFRFTRRTTRDALLQKARERRGLTSAELGLEGAPLHVFFNERLTRLNRLLSAKAREDLEKFCDITNFATEFLEDFNDRHLGSSEWGKMLGYEEIKPKLSDKENS